MATTPSSAAVLTRREALRRVSLLLGGATLIGENVWLAAEAAPSAESKSLFSASEVALLDEIADTILPTTSTPGAKAAGVGPFIAVMVRDVYDPRQQKLFRSGLATLERECRKQNGAAFMACTPAQRTALLERLDREQYAQRDSGAPHYFRMMKELTLLGYFTSEIGYTQAMRYTETPGRFDPCVPYTPGEKSWAPHA
ncbi:MAG: gluconate 2-dehydrogenase subunit 3 family protein [Gammaproteobacteria bacterium]